MSCARSQTDSSVALFGRSDTANDDVVITTVASAAAVLSTMGLQAVMAAPLTEG